MGRKMENLRIFLLFSIIVSILFFAGCVADKAPPGPKVEIKNLEELENKKLEQKNLEQYQENKTEPAAVVDECKQHKNVLEQDECYLKQALEKNDQKICKKIYSIENLDKCLVNFANQNPKICSELNSPILREKCFEEAAYRTNDTNYCLKLQDEKKLKCLKDLSPPCTFEKDEFSTNLCYAKLYNDLKYCKNDDNCILKYAIEKNSAQACEKIDEQQLAIKSACYALTKGELQECKKANLTAIIDRCYEIVAYSKSDKNICLYITPGTVYSDNCIKKFAIETKDFGFCSRTEPEINRDRCYRDYSIARGEWNVCEKIYSSLIKLECYYKTALENMDLDACNQLNYQARMNCLNNVLNSNKTLPNLEICSKIRGDDRENWMDKCYLKYALEQKDIAACNYIKEKTKNKECVDALS